MKLLTACLLVGFVSIAFAAVTLEDIVKLSRAKTGDEVILKLIEKEGIAKPVSSKDVVYLKEQGVSDRVIQYLVKLSSADKPVPSGDNLRTYYTTTKTGKRIPVITNIDESGKRMGGEVPPDPAPANPEAYGGAQQEPREIRVIVENDSRRPEYPEPYPEPYVEEYVDDRYEMPPFPSYYPYSTGYYPSYTPYYDPYFPGSFFPRDRNHSFDSRHRNPSFDPNQVYWRAHRGKNQSFTRPRPQRSQSSQKSAHAGMRTSRIR